MVIQFKKNEDIDKQLWDNCIANSFNGRVYAMSWYLDAMASGWGAIVTDNYDFIMPLPIRKKWGFAYIFQPAFTQQLGIFSSKRVTTSIANEFIGKIKLHFNYAEINFNSENILAETNELILKKNFLLPLNSSYLDLQKSFSRSAKRNICKAIKCNIEIEESNDCSILMQLHRERYGYKFATKNEFVVLETLLNKAKQNGMAYFFYAKKLNGNYIASSGYLLFKNRIIFLINGNLTEGLETGATHLLKNYVLKKFANTDLIMDFEGSDTEAFARFYEQYGAKNLDSYPFLKFNNLPQIIKIFKR